VAVPGNKYFQYVLFDYFIRTIDCEYYQYGDQIKDDLTCVEGMRNTYRVWVVKSYGKRPLGRRRRRWEDNVKVELTEILVRWDGVGLIHTVLHRRMVQDLTISYTGQRTSYWLLKKTLFHLVCWLVGWLVGWFYVDSPAENLYKHRSPQNIVKFNV
jgi:hypothetical protein